MSKGNRYRVLRGLNYPHPTKDGEEKRAEVGEIVDDLPEDAVAGLIEDGVIEEAGSATAKRSTAEEEPE